MRKVLYVSGTRADYGLMRTTLKAIEAHPDLDLVVVATGMHLMPEFGRTVEDIVADGFRVLIAEASIATDDRGATPRFLGRLIEKLADIVEKERPDEILLLGDRAEMLAGAIVGTYMGIPTFHVHGGDVSSTVDEHARHAITKLSHVHLPATERSADRILRMGEAPENVIIVGSPSLDSLSDLVPEPDIRRTYGVGQNDYLLMVQHPVSEEMDRAAEQMRGVISAILDIGTHAVVIYPNADAGGRRMIQVIQDVSSPLFHCYRSVPRDHYLQLLLQSKALVGNSSSGLVEAPSLGVPFVNVGSRQKDRERGDNVIDVGYGKDEVLRGLSMIDDPALQQRLGQRRNPYGDGRTGDRIAKVLAEKPLGNGLVQKRLSYE